jgi:hypothetical protein
LKKEKSGNPVAHEKTLFFYFDFFSLWRFEPFLFVPIFYYIMHEYIGLYNLNCIEKTVFSFI